MIIVLKVDMKPFNYSKVFSTFSFLSNFNIVKISLSTLPQFHFVVIIIYYLNNMCIKRIFHSIIINMTIIYSLFCITIVISKFVDRYGSFYFVLKFEFLNKRSLDIFVSYSDRRKKA